MSQRISKIAKVILDKYNIDRVGHGFVGVTDDIFNEAWPGKKRHPLDKMKAVLSALDRESKGADALFIKRYINAFGRDVRLFVLESGEL